MLARWWRYALTVPLALAFLQDQAWTQNVYVSRQGSDTFPYNTWGRAAHDIQTAIDYAKANPGLITDVLVAEDPNTPYTASTGVVYPAPNGDSRRDTILLDGISWELEVHGGFKHGVMNDPDGPDGSFKDTILDGQGTQYHVVAVRDSGGALHTPLVLDGFRITGGNSVSAGSITLADRTGAGVVCETSHLRVENCIVHGNVGGEPGQVGGGIAVIDQSGRSFRCALTEIYENHAELGSGIHVERGQSFLSHLDIHDNGAFAPDDVADCDRGGGIHVGIEAEAWISNCEIHDNLSDDGGAAWIDVTSIGTHWANCTIAYNDRPVGTGGPGGMNFQHSPTATPTAKHFIENTIVYFNDVTDVLVGVPMGGTPGEVVATYSDVGAFGTGLVTIAPFISLDPKFINGARRDFKLRFDPFDLSPCIDAGSDFLMGADFNDVDVDLDVTYPVPLDLTMGLREVANAALPTPADPGFDGAGGVPPTGDPDPTSTDIVGAIVDMGAHEAPTGIAGPPQQ